ncbi:MAG: RDD family protein [Taibaiella sp.]|nr:RDD family protein [Taibaiella sp.]
MDNPDIDPNDYLVLASRGKRFLHYIIDYVVFLLVLFALGLLLGWIFVITDFEGWNMNVDEAELNQIDRLVSLLLYALLGGLIEGITRGRTVAKYLTNTVAVQHNGEKISFGQGFKRGLIKAVPFVQFSALGNPSYPWQDRWTGTYVIDIAKTKEKND